MPTLKLYNKRILDVQKALKKQGVVNKNEFLLEINFQPFNLDKVKKGKMGFTIEQIDLCIRKYKINPAFFFDSKAKMY